MIAKRIGMSEEATIAARQFQSSSAGQATLLAFVKRVIASKGFVKDDEIQAVRDAGYSDGQIAEAIGYIGLATYSNLFNHVHDTPLDFPAASTLA
jgi:alkylhydroperoxidase family enzyme